MHENVEIKEIDPKTVHWKYYYVTWSCRPFFFFICVCQVSTCWWAATCTCFLYITRCDGLLLWNPLVLCLSSCRPGYKVCSKFFWDTVCLLQLTKDLLYPSRTIPVLKVPIPTSAQHLGRGYLPATVLATQPPLYLDRVLLAQMQLPSQVMLPQLSTAMDPLHCSWWSFYSFLSYHAATTNNYNVSISNLSNVPWRDFDAETHRL